MKNKGKLILLTRDDQRIVWDNIDTRTTIVLIGLFDILAEREKPKPAKSIKQGGILDKITGFIFRKRKIKNKTAGTKPMSPVEAVRRGWA